MTLNLSHNAVCPKHSLKESLFSSNILGKWYTDKNAFNLKLANCQYCTKEKTEKVSDDIIDLLPSDPFDMDLISKITEIKAWLKDIEKDLELESLGFITDPDWLDDIKKDLELNSLGFITDPVKVEWVDNQLSTGMNLVCNGAVKFHLKIHELSIGSDKGIRAGRNDGIKEEIMHFIFDKYWISTNAANVFQECTDDVHWDDKDGDVPHDALFFALGYLGVRDLLSVEKVCKSLRDAVRNDPLLWRSIHIDLPLNYRVTDDFLLRLTSRAQGTLQCLSLVDCYWISDDDGLKHVLESNPGLTKLSVPGCLRLSIEGILCNLKSLKSAGKLRIKHLRINRIGRITYKQLEEIKFVLGIDNHKQLNARKPRFNDGRGLYLPFFDDWVINLEECPRCHKVKQVFDCPAESCQEKHRSAQICRACIICIARCMHCGRCINDDGVYRETFFLHVLCLNCWKQFLNCQNGEEETDIQSMKCTIVHQQTRYHFCLDG
ncbi:F-box protein [Actinidia chinensis var. chinensis]|uniref:F-box protein n=1 Tax=Actinidia chinensis var. chinensis TaxID=1590841 RepID=A0A2R6RZ14_ACTCC|nr:F-box protein [Actinidia chinensis var. chinensis]